LQGKEIMELRDQILSDLQQALRIKDSQRLKTLRLLRAAVTNAEIENRRSLTSEEVIKVIAQEAKRQREAIAEYSNLGRQDLVEDAQSELRILEEYLPDQLTRAEIEMLVSQAIGELGINSPSQIGTIMRHLMPRLKGQADGHLVNQVVQELLSKYQHD
jgi:uncharacterized protein